MSPDDCLRGVLLSLAQVEGSCQPGIERRWIFEESLSGPGRSQPVGLVLSRAVRRKSRRAAAGDG